MPKFAVFTPKQIELIVREAPKDAGVSLDEWVSRMLTAFAALVHKRPQAYRSFGLSWWAVKALMVKHGLLPVEMPDADNVANVSFGSPEMDVAAAFAYHEHSMENQTYMNQNIVVDTDDGETLDYVLVDDELEAVAAMAVFLA